MPSYTVDLKSMINASHTMASTMTTIRGRCQQALDEVQSAQSAGWLDEAADAFSSQIQQWVSDQSQMLGAMQEFSNALAASESDYDKVSKQNASAF